MTDEEVRHAEEGHSEERIIAALKQYESGEKVADTWRELGVSEALFYTWKKQYAGMGVQELPELRQLRDENGRLQRLVADLALDRQILQEIVSKKAVKPRQRCRLAGWAQEAYQIGARRSARLVKVPWTTLLYKAERNRRRRSAGACGKSQARMCVSEMAG